MNYLRLLNEIIKKYDYQSITYQNISVPDGWIVECKLSKKLNGSSYSAISYEKDINLATKNAARLVYDQISKIDDFQSIDNPFSPKPTQKNPFTCKTKKTCIRINDPLPSRPTPKPINIIEYQIKREELDKELDEYMKELLDRDRQYIETPIDIQNKIVYGQLGEFVERGKACKLSPR